MSDEQIGEEQEHSIPLDELEAPQRSLEEDEVHAPQSAADLEAVFDVPVRISAVLGHSRMHVSDLLKLASGTVLELDRKVGEAIDIYVNDRLVARGEVVLVEDKLGVTMTEIIKTDR
ncbi:flagellar motor switch protein FliN [Roseibium porphyridii]|uniref:Flagellar motor switch protein FliN n=2 Tax=Roseibium TaxID=150830 RepID=A0ABY8F7J4_9HYPH|nr:MULTISPECIES: flagellar motor switch protein FliN [Stappiaceae]QFT30719.1 Flagellar motor switch protein FliN [Labrenzia sp. THAF82]WFE91349.1 flagellar motor switch protein FliN [Roseibium sp. KMA01]